MRLYIFLTIIILFLSCIVGCGGGGGKDEENYFNIVLAAIQPYREASAWESWNMGAILTGNDKKDYSFIAKVIITRNGDKVFGFGNANAYDLGNFYINGTRTGDNLDFELLSQNRYRAFKLSGRGIYLDAGTKIGGNRLEGSDFSTVFDDPIDYDGNFTATVGQLSTPVAGGIFSGDINGAYNSIENGKIRFTVSNDSSSVTLNSLSGSLVGATQTEGTFNYDNPSAFSTISLEANKFTSVAVIDGNSYEIDGVISGSIASGIVIIQKTGKTYVGAFTALTG